MELFIRNVSGFAARQQVPLVVFAGGRDHFRNGCCTAAKDQDLQAAPQAAGKSFVLTIYPDADHDFVLGGMNYNEQDYNDALQRTAAALRSFFARSR
jgi:dienelactone hydrolase